MGSKISDICLSSSSSSECSAQGQVLHCKHRNLGCSSAEGRSSTTNSKPRLQFYQGLKRCSSFLLLSAPHSLFSIWTNLKRSEKTPGAPTWRSGGWIWLSGPSGLHRNSPQGLNISSIRVFDQIRDPESQSPFTPFLLQLSKAPENLNQKKLTWPGIEPRPARWEATMLPLNHSSGLCSFKLMVNVVRREVRKFVYEYDTNRQVIL